MKRLLLAAALISLCVPAFADNLAKGVYEVRAEAEWDVLYDGHDQAVPARGGLGYYFTDNIQGGGLLYFSKKDVDSFWGVDDVWGLGLFGEYNFDSDSPLVPFAGGSLMLLDGDDSGGDSAVVFTALGGVKYFITRTIALCAQLNLNLATEEIYDFDRDDQVEDDVKGDGEVIDISADLGLRIVLW